MVQADAEFAVGEIAVEEMHAVGTHAPILMVVAIARPGAQAERGFKIRAGLRVVLLVEGGESATIKIPPVGVVEVLVTGTGNHDGAAAGQPAQQHGEQECASHDQRHRAWTFSAHADPPRSPAPDYPHPHQTLPGWRTGV